MSSTMSQGSFAPTSCGSCSGYIYEDDGYNWDGEGSYEDDENNYEDYGDEDGSSNTSWASQSQASTVASSSGCNTPVAGRFSSISSMSSLFGGSSSPSFSSASSAVSFAVPQQPPQRLPYRGIKGPAPGYPFSSSFSSSSSSSLSGRTPLMSKRSQNSSHRCTCQRSTSTSTSSGLWNASSSTAGPFSGSVNSGQSQDLSQAITGTGTGTTDTGTQLSVFSNNSNSTNGQNQASDGFQTPISPPRPTTQIEYRTRESPQDKSGNSIIKNLNVYNPNITIQMTPSTFSKFDKLFVPKQSGGGFGGNGSSN